MFTRLSSGVSTLVLAAVLAACSTAPSTVMKQDRLNDESNQALGRLKEVDPSLSPLLDRSTAYAIFPVIGEGAAGIGGAYGRGQVYEHGKMTGYCDMSQGTIGPQLGGQKYMELVVFGNDSALARFKANDFTFAADASAVAAKDGGAAHADFSDGVLVFTHPISGLILQAAIGGQRFTFKPADQVRGDYREAMAH